MRPFQLLIVFALLATIFLLPARQAGADEGDIQVLSQSAESRFPDGIEFKVSVESTSEIDDIRVYYKTLGIINQSAYRPVEFEPGMKVVGTTLLKSHGSTSFFPPGTRVEYSFEIRDKSGSILRTEDQEFVYIDRRFEWRTATSGLITVYYYGEDKDSLAQTILDAAREAMDLMGPILGIEPTDPLRIVAYNNYAHMTEALPFRSQATSEQLITQGMAFSNLRVLLINGSDAGVRGFTAHEFVHLLVSEAAGRADQHVPSWLNEGLAEYGNVDSDEYDSALRFGIANQRLRPLWSQSSFGGTPDDIIIAYGQGKSVVAYMIETHGPEKIGQLMETLRKTRDIDLALEEVYGFDQYGLDSEWRVSLGLEPLPPPERLEVAFQQIPTDPPPTEPAPDKEPEVAQPTAAKSGGDPAEAPEVEPGPSGGQGCNMPKAYAASGLHLDLGALLMLAAPLGLLWAPRLRRRNK